MYRIKTIFKKDINKIKIIAPELTSFLSISGAAI